MRYRLGFLVVVLAALFSASAFAQKVTGSVTGTVTDPQGAVVPGATVTLTDVGTNFARTATSSTAGSYEFQELNPGPYPVKVPKTEFAKNLAPKVKWHSPS